MGRVSFIFHTILKAIPAHVPATNARNNPNSLIGNYCYVYTFFALLRIITPANAQHKSITYSLTIFSFRKRYAITEAIIGFNACIMSTSEVFAN